MAVSFFWKKNSKENFLLAEGKLYKGMFGMFGCLSHKIHRRNTEITSHSYTISCLLQVQNFVSLFQHEHDLVSSEQPLLRLPDLFIICV